jgi:hypothetical protein
MSSRVVYVVAASRFISFVSTRDVVVSRLSRELFTPSPSPSRVVYVVAVAVVAQKCVFISAVYVVAAVVAPRRT